MSNLKRFGGDAMGAVRVAIIMIGGYFGAVEAGNALFPFIWYDLKQVTVEDHAIGEDPETIAYRNISLGGWLYWTITIRGAQNDRYIEAFRHDPVDYKPRAGAINPLIMPQSEWIGVNGAMEKLNRNRDYGPGLYYMTTCHHKMVLKRCRRSNDYERFEAAQR